MKKSVPQTLDHCFTHMANAMAKQNTYNNCLYISLNYYRGRGVAYSLETSLLTRLSEITAPLEIKEEIKQTKKLFEGHYFKKGQYGDVLTEKATPSLSFLLDELLGEKQDWSLKEQQRIKALENIITMANSCEKDHEHAQLFVASPQAVHSPQKTETTYKNWQKALATTPMAQTCYRLECWSVPTPGAGFYQTQETLYATTVDELVTQVALFLIQKNRFLPNDLDNFPLHEEMILEKIPSLSFSNSSDQKLWEIACCQRTKKMLGQNLSTKLQHAPKKGMKKL